MNLNVVASGTEPFDMTTTDEFASLCASASDLGISHSAQVRYTSRQIVARQHRFHVLDWGPEDAQPLVLLHGGNQSAHSWDLVSLHLADRYRVIAPDQRGHGDSEWARNADYNSQTMAEDAEALIETLGLQNPVIMGHSMGGRNALMLTLGAPTIGRALVVVDVGPEISERGRKVIGSFIAENEEFSDLNKFIDNVRKYDPYRSQEHIERTVKYNLFERADGSYVSKCDRAPRKLGLTNRDADLDQRLNLTTVSNLAMPTLIIRGEQSNILTEDAAIRFADALPNAILKTVPECGHNVHSQNTPGFLGVVNEFLAQL